LRQNIDALSAAQLDYTDDASMFSQQPNSTTVAALLLGLQVGTLRWCELDCLAVFASGLALGSSKKIGGA
jgi:hypothetical protein